MIGVRMVMKRTDRESKFRTDKANADVLNGSGRSWIVQSQGCILKIDLIKLTNETQGGMGKGKNPVFIYISRKKNEIGKEMR